MMAGSTIATFIVLILVLEGFASIEAVEEGKGNCKPEAVHLSFGDTTREMAVMWYSEDECSTRVQYATNAWHLNLTADGTSKKMDCHGENATKFMHRVVLKNLKIGSTVFYRIISGDDIGTNAYFKVPNFTEPSDFLVVNQPADAHQKTLVKSLVKEADSRAFTGLFYLSEPQSLIAQKGGESLLNTMREPAVNIPIFTSSDWGTEGSNSKCDQQMFSPFGFPWPLNSSPRWYSHDVGPIHVIRYSPRVFLEGDSDQAKAMQKWMIEDLSRVNLRRNITPWVIALGLDPMYCSEASHGLADCSRNDSKLRRGLEDVFYSFAVDLIVEQQDGPYERTWPHYKGVVVGKSYLEPSAPVEIIMGLGKTLTPKVDQTNSTEMPDWTALRLEDAGGESYSRLTVANASHLHWQLLSALDGSLLDEMWLVQPQHGNFSLSALPHNVSHQINQSIIAMGGKPGTYDFIGTLTPGQRSGQGEGWSKYSLWFGLALVGAAIGIGLGTVTVRSYLKRRRGKGGRRWQEVDRHGSAGGHFYSVASDTDTDEENDNDFEIDMFERTSKSGSKLLTSY